MHDAVRVLVFAMALVVASCATDERPSALEPDDTVPATVTSTSAPAMSTTSAPSPSFAFEVTPASAPPPADSTGLSGSGCGPGDVDALPDGRWLVLVSSSDTDGADFDLTCHDAATGQISNTNTRSRHNGWHPQSVQYIDSTPGPIDLGSLSTSTHYWIAVNDGLVTHLVPHSG